MYVSGSHELGNIEGWNPLKKIGRAFKKIRKIQIKKPFKALETIFTTPFKAVLPTRLTKLKPFKQPLKFLTVAAETPIRMLPKEIVPKEIRRLKVLKTATLPIRWGAVPAAAALGLNPSHLGLEGKISSDDWSKIKKGSRIAAAVAGAAFGGYALYGAYAASSAAGGVATVGTTIGTTATVAEGVATASTLAKIGSGVLGVVKAAAPLAIPMLLMRGGGPQMATGPEGEPQYFDENGNAITEAEYLRMMEAYEAEVSAIQTQTQDQAQQAPTEVGVEEVQVAPEDIFQAALEYYQDSGMAPQQAQAAAQGVMSGTMPMVEEIAQGARQIAVNKAGMLGGLFKQGWVMPAVIAIGGIAVTFYLMKGGGNVRKRR